MRNFLLLCMAALCCLACNDSKIVTITVTNPLAMDRSDEMVEVSIDRNLKPSESGRHRTDCGSECRRGAGALPSDLR